MGSSSLIVLICWTGTVAGPPVLIAAWMLLRRPGRFCLAFAVTAPLGMLYALGVWTVLIEPNLLVTREITVQSPGWKGPPVRLGLISDTHVSAPHVDPQRMRRVVARMNALHPDAVLLLGDYAGGHEPAAVRAVPQRSQVLQGIATFKALKAPLGVFAVLGNHDWWYDGPAIEAALGRAGATVLENQAVAVERSGGRFWIAGLADLDSFRTEPSYLAALATTPANEPVVAMTHWPDPFAGAPDRVALTIAGHTHCGQVNLPVLGRLVHASRAARKWGCGLYIDRGRRLFVTGGVGVSILPVRFRVPPELVIVTLEAEQP